MQRTLLATGLLGFMALGALAAGSSLLKSPDTGSDPAPVTASAALFESLASRSQGAGFASLSGPWEISLPEDHGGHDEARIETWTLLAHLESEEGDPLGLQLSITRLGLVPDHSSNEAPAPGLTALYRSHVVLTDAAADTVEGEERLSRGMGAAGHDLDAGEIWHDDWVLAYGGGDGQQGLNLKLTVEGVPISLELTPSKPAEQIAQAQGLRGFVIPRLSVEGLFGGQRVQGTAFLNRAWGDVPLPGGAVANDIVSIQLKDGSDLSLVRTTRRDGRGKAVVDGVLSESDATILASGDNSFSLVPVTGSGDDPATAREVTWQISGPGLVLEAVPLLSETHEHFAFAFASGLLSVTGTRNGQPVAGLGSLQSTQGGP